MAQHTIIGERIISRIDYLVPIARIIRSAHERWDGAGYPDGYRGEEIPLASRILLVCDAFDAMTTDRPYRGALPDGDRAQRARRYAGTQFDPRVVDVFLAAYPFASRETERHSIRLGSFAGVLRAATREQPRVGGLVRGHERLAPEPLLHRAAALGRVDLVDARERLHHLVGGLDDEPRAAVLDHLGHRPLAHGDHGRAAGERLDHHEAERLRPLDGEQRAAGALVELDLGLVVDLAAEVDVVGEVRLDLRGEELALRALVDLAGHDEALVEAAGHLDGRVRALVGGHAADEQQVVVLLGAERHVLHVDGVGDRADELQVGEPLALVLADGDEPEVGAQRARASPA